MRILDDRFFVFQSQEEREDFFAREKQDIYIDHQDRLAGLRSDYLAGIKTDPDKNDEFTREYMSNVKKEYEAFFRRLADIEKRRSLSRLETDLARSP